MLKIYVHKKTGHDAINVVLTMTLCVLQDEIYLQKYRRGTTVTKLKYKKKKKGILISLREAVKAKQLLFHIK